VKVNIASYCIDIWLLVILTNIDIDWDKCNELKRLTFNANQKIREGLKCRVIFLLVYTKKLIELWKKEKKTLKNSKIANGQYS
jgi:hypothetical protein